MKQLMNLTSIEWVKNSDGTQGYTWNPITGCLNHINGMCKGGGFPCYAYRLAHGRLRQRYLANPRVPEMQFYRDTYLDHKPTVGDPFYPRFWPERLLDIPEDWRTLAGIQRVNPRGIFVCDMGELFGDWIPLEWQSRVFTKFIQCPQHRFYLLTKQPQNLAKWSPFPDNCWVGVTATNLDMLKAALTALTEVKASIKYLSLEPLLGRMQENSFGGFSQRVFIEAMRWYDKIDWLIIGAQTKPYKPPKIEWVQEIVETAGNAGVPVFLKDNLERLWADSGFPVWASDGMGNLRQEIPND